MYSFVETYNYFSTMMEGWNNGIMENKRLDSY